MVPVQQQSSAGAVTRRANSPIRESERGQSVVCGARIGEATSSFQRIRGWLQATQDAKVRGQIALPRAAPMAEDEFATEEGAVPGTQIGGWLRQQDEMAIALRAGGGHPGQCSRLCCSLAR